jgi:copper transport protein
VSIRRAAAVASVALVLVLGLPAAAGAHANLVSSDPSSGATLATAPGTMTLGFSEAPDLALSAVELLTTAGAQVPTGTPTLDGSRTLVVPITGTLADGVYTVTWRVVSAVDGHVTAGAFPFGVGTSPTSGAVAAATTTTTSEPTPLSVASLSLLYAGSMLVVAGAVVGVWVLDGGPTSRRRIAAWAAVAAAIGAVGFLFAQQRTAGVPMGTYLRSETGRDPLWIAIGSTVALVFAIAAGRTRWHRAGWAAAIAAAATLGLRAHGGHAASAPMPALAQLLQWTHMLAAGCWAGGLALLVLLLRERRADPPSRAARRYSAMAVAAIVLVVATGLVRAASELGGLDGVRATLDTAYGRTLAGKIALVLFVIALGAVNRYRSIGRLPEDPRPLRRIAGTELVSVVGILALTATLTGLAPPTTPSATTPSAANVTLTGSDFATTLSATLTVAPGTPGRNDYRATIVDYGTDTPDVADAVSLQLRSVSTPELPPATVRLHPDGDGWIGDALAPSVAGTYAATLSVRSGSDVAEVPLVLTTRSTGTTTTTPGPGGDTIATASFPDGASVDTSSGSGSPSQVHITAFAGDGTELRLTTATLVAIPDGGSPQRLHLRRFSAGHFAANAELPPGKWVFDTVLVGRDGTAYQVTWTGTIG